LVILYLARVFLTRYNEVLYGNNWDLLNHQKKLHRSICMKLINLFVPCVISLAPTAASQNSQDTTEFFRLEDVWNQSHVRGDASALDSLWAQELVVTASGMTPMTKGQTMAFFRSGRMKFQQYTSSEIRVRLLGETAIVTGRVQRRRTMGDRNVGDDWLFTKTYIRRAGRWQVAAWHASLPP
jgi:hypothetical protein